MQPEAQPTTGIEVAPPSPMGEATPAPPLLLFLLWIPVFAVVAWGMMLLFGRRPWEFHADQPLEPVIEPDEEAR